MVMNTNNSPPESGYSHVNIRQSVKNLDALPAMPSIARKLLSLQLDTEEGERMLLVLIGQDPLICAKIIGLANSAKIGASRKISTVSDATALLGFKRVQSVSTSIAIMTLMTKASTGRLNMHDLWLHSVGVAFAMFGIARFMPAKLRPQDDQIFLAGLLHDIGYLALAFIDLKHSDRLHARLAIETSCPSREVEQKILDICHDELGAELAHHWNLPDEIVAAIRYHHTPDEPGAALAQPLVHMISMAEKLLGSFGINEHVDNRIGADEWNTLGIDPNKVEQVRDQVAEQAEQAMQFISTFD